MTKVAKNFEIWRSIVGYEGLYEVSDLGNVKSLERLAANGYVIRTVRERVLKPRIADFGYPMVNLYKNGVKEAFKVHRLVGKAFIPNPKNLPQINHKNGNRKDNRLENLEWVNRRENISHGGKNGTSSNYTGVYWHKTSKQFRASIMINGKLLHIALCRTQEEAGMLYDLALDHFGLTNRYRNNIDYQGDMDLLNAKFENFKLRIGLKSNK